MRICIPDTRVDLASGRRFDTYVGNGERIEVPQGFTPEQVNNSPAESR